MNDYVFSQWRKSRGGGTEPALSGTGGYLQLAEPGRGAAWALWSVSDFKPARNRRAVPATAALRDLIRSAEGYPPALAIARDDLTRRGQTSWGPEEIAASYEASLRRVLRAQHSSPFLIAEASGEEVGYLSRGDFCWVLRYRPAERPGGIGTVQWVSGDFFIYSNPASDFLLTPRC